MKLILLACCAGRRPGHCAQTWPTKPVRVIVTFSPGGSSDIVARLIAAPLQAELGQPVIVDNKPGAGGTIGALEVARAAPDGYTLLLSNSAPISISPAMQDQPRYDPVEGFTHVAYIGSVANVFVVHPSVPAKHAARAGGLDQGAAQPGELRLRRHRLDRPPRRRDAEEGPGPEDGARRLQGLRADAQRPARAAPSSSRSTRCRRTCRS